MNPNVKMLEGPKPIDKAAALHVAGGNKTGREELLWQQREIFERAVAEARLANMQTEVETRRKAARADRQLTKLQAGAAHASFYTRDWRKHTRKLFGYSVAAGKRDSQMRRRLTEGLA